VAVAVLLLANGDVVVRDASSGASAGRVGTAGQRGALAATGAEVPQRTPPSPTATAPGRTLEKRQKATKHRIVLDRRSRCGIG